jgi:hypothetical protein
MLNLKRLFFFMETSPDARDPPYAGDEKSEREGSFSKEGTILGWQVCVLDSILIHINDSYVLGVTQFMRA